jgi:predicted N-acetyltransferase YhbS
MLAYAEESLAAATDRGQALRVYINDADAAFQDVAAAMGYQKGGGSEPMSCLAVSSAPAPVSLPAGFRLKSLADDNDLRKVARVLWRGFNHEGDPPEEEIDDRRFIQSAPNFRRDLNVVVQAPGGDLVSYCGMWYESVHRIAMVEPVATDPDYRRQGLGRAAVLEGVRRCAERGATIAYVGSSKPFYQSIGFRQVYNCSIWRREWE